MGGAGPTSIRSDARARAARPEFTVAARWLPVLAGGLAWAHWPALRQMADRWSHDPRYSHGYLVPLFAVALMLSGATQHMS